LKACLVGRSEQDQRRSDEKPGKADVALEEDDPDDQGGDARSRGHDTAAVEGLDSRPDGRGAPAALLAIPELQTAEKQ